MSHNITPPSPGEVTLTLSFDEAEVLTRLVGQVVASDLKDHAPDLFAFHEAMMPLVGNAYISPRKYTLENKDGRSSVSIRVVS